MKDSVTQWGKSTGGKNELGICRNRRGSNSEQEHPTRRGRARSGETTRNLNVWSLRDRNPLRSSRLEDHFEATMIIQIKANGDWVRQW